ncbi:MAG: hypothetical protein IPM49_11440 [Flavobacteriales bacterium]|nr:hypothetical protein [Flavobacteriales bacterium]
MSRRTAGVLVLLPLVAQAQLLIPGLQPSDTVTRPCPVDTSVSLLCYAGWEAYQTVDDTWDGPRDSTACIPLAHVSGGGVEARIDFDDADPARPVFLRLLLDSTTAIPLTADNEYVIALDGYPLPGTTVDAGIGCTEGMCTGIRAAVRIPDSTGTGSDLRWYQSSYGSGQFGSPFSVCVPTEGFADNALRELVLKFTLASPGPGQQYRLYWPSANDLLQQGALDQLVEADLPQFQTGPSSFTMWPVNGFNFLVMYEDTTYPSADQVSYLDITPLPNVSQPTPVTLTLEPFTGFNFQPFTQLRGGPVLNNDSIYHPLTVVNNGADLCLSWQIVELFWGHGDRYVHQAGHLGFEGQRSCFLFRRGSTLEVAPGSTLHYGRDGRGMLALLAGSDVVVGSGAELVMHGTVVLMEGPGASTREDLHTRLGPGARLRFAPGSSVFNGNSYAQDMKWVITLDGGTADLDGLSATDRQKVVLVQLPEVPLTELAATVLPNAVQLQVATRMTGSGTVRCFDALGRCLLEQRVSLAPGGSTIRLDTPGWLAGSYFAVLEVNGERRVARWVIP